MSQKIRPKFVRFQSTIPPLIISGTKKHSKSVMVSVVNTVVWLPHTPKETGINSQAENIDPHFLTPRCFGTLDTSQHLWSVS